MSVQKLRLLQAGLTLSLGFALAGCPEPPPDNDGGTGLECGPGTIEQNGTCVIDPNNEPEPTDGGEDPTLECGPGTVPNISNTQCVPDLDCAPGTTENEDGTGCVAECNAPFSYDTDASACVCPEGLRPTDDGSDCELDPAACAEGTVYQDGQCRPVTPPMPSDDETVPEDFVEIILEENKELDLGGVIGPVDRELGPDFDFWRFTTSEDLTRVRVQLNNFGLPNGMYILQGIDADNEVYFRAALPLQNRRAIREFVLPFAGTYEIIVSDVSNFTNGLAVGGDDANYHLVVEQLESVDPIVVPGTGAEVNGNIDNADAYVADVNDHPAGAILSARLAQEEPDPDCDTQQVLWFIANDGSYVESNVCAGDINTLLAQGNMGTPVYVDYILRTGFIPEYPYQFRLSAYGTSPGPVANDTPIDDSTSGRDNAFFSIDVQDNHVYRATLQLPSSSTLTADFAVTNGDLQERDFDGTSSSVDGLDTFELEWFVPAGEAGTWYLQVLNDENAGVFQQPNNNVRLALEEAAVVGLQELNDDTPITEVLAAPADTDEDAWNVPWTMVRLNAFGGLEVKTTDDVEFDVYNPTDMSTVASGSAAAGDGEYARNFLLLPGAELLVRAHTGTGTGDFTRSFSVIESPFTWETEPNDNATSAGAADAVPPPYDFGDTPAAQGHSTGTCDASAPEVTATGLYELTLDGNETDEFGGDCSRSGADVQVRIPQQPAGTLMIIETLSEGDNGSNDTVIGLVPTDGCDPDTTICLAYDDDGGDSTRSKLEYVWRGDEGTLTAIIGRYSGSFTAGSLLFTAEFRDGITSNGVSQDGDVDFWQIDVPEAGFLQVNVVEGPLGIDDATLALELQADDGLSLGGTEGDLDLGLEGYVEAGTYFAVVSHVDGSGADYTVTWELDTTRPAPSSCDVPTPITGSGEYTGDTSTSVDVVNSTGCVDGPTTPDDIYSVIVPPDSVLQVSIEGDFDTTLQLINACDATSCLVADDNWFTDGESIEYRNRTPDNETLFIAVSGWLEVGTYTLTVDVASPICYPGFAQCNGDNLEVCNDAGDGYDSFPCDAGCAYNAFEQTAECNAFCGGDTGRLDTICNGTDLMVCEDGARYVVGESCIGACEDIQDEMGTVTGSTCTFGACGVGFGQAVCEQRNIGGSDVFVFEDCNGDASVTNVTSCAYGCNGDRTNCATQVVPVVDLSGTVANSNGACSDMANGDVVDTSGTFALTLDGNGITDANQCGDDGADGYFRLGSHPAGTEVTIDIDAADGASVGLLIGGCAAGSCTDLDVGTNPSVTYTFTGGEDVIVVVDTEAAPVADGGVVTDGGIADGGIADGGTDDAGTDAGTDAGADPLPTVDVTVSYTLAPATADAICTPDETVCDSGSSLLTTCSADGLSESVEYCDMGCNGTNDGCLTQCEAAYAMPTAIADGETLTWTVNPSEGPNDILRDCASGSTVNEAYIVLTPAVSGDLTVTIGGADTVLEVRETCAQDATVLDCVDDEISSDESITIAAVAGETYVWLVEAYSSFNSSDIDVEATLTAAP